MSKEPRSNKHPAEITTMILMGAITGWLPDLENLEIRPGGLENLEKQVFFSGKP